MTKFRVGRGDYGFCVRDFIHYVLMKNNRARNDDEHLYYLVAKECGRLQGFDIDRLTVKQFMEYQHKRFLPPMETVRRQRQVQQEQFPELR